MAVAQMAKASDGGAADEPRGGEKDQATSMRVYKPEAAAWNRLAAIRGISSVAELMRADDVREFVSHAIMKEAARIQREQAEADRKRQK